MDEPTRALQWCRGFLLAVLGVVGLWGAALLTAALTRLPAADSALIFLLGWGWGKVQPIAKATAGAAALVLGLAFWLAVPPDRRAALIEALLPPTAGAPPPVHDPVPDLLLTGGP